MFHTVLGGWCERIELKPLNPARINNIQHLWIQCIGDGKHYIDEVVEVPEAAAAVYVSPLGVVFE